MSKKNKQKEKARAKQQKKWRQQHEEFQGMRAKAPYTKRILRHRGCNLPFYDYLDSYEDEFKKIVASALEQHKSLLGVHEVDNSIYYETDWSRLGYEGLRQVFFTFDGADDYGKHPDSAANISGSATAFFDDANQLRTVILIPQSIKTTFKVRDMKYAVKIAALCHEIGHVRDLESGSNFDLNNGTADIIEAEVFAHLEALDLMAKRSLCQSFNMLADALRHEVNNSGYLGDVSRKVIERMPDHKFVDWQALLNEPFTEEEARIIGPAGVRMLGE